MKKILFVDDEAQILKSLLRLFMDTEYEIITAESGEAALKILEKEEINMVVSDMRMPNMDGYTLLTRVKELYPGIMRMVLSGYSDEKVVFRALQKNIAKLYMFKPWENDKLLDIIVQMFETEEILKSSNLLLLINNIENLPTIKANYQRIMQLIDNDADISMIVSEIEKDASIATKILHVANSAYFGAKTGSVKQAVSYIGLNNTRSLILSTSIIDTMSNTGAAGKYIEKIWQHAFISNKLMNFIFERHLNKKLPENSASAGLLMNIGVVFFLKYYKDKYLNIFIDSVKRTLSITELERETFKVTHCEAGGYLLKWWEFPYAIIETALYHHDPMNEKIIHKEIVCAAHIASNYASELSGGKCRENFDVRALEFLRISKSDFEASMAPFKI